MSLLTRRALAALIIMLCSALIANRLKPTENLADARVVKVQLESTVPTAFGSWRLEAGASASVVNPQQQEMIDKLYSQTLSRIYVDELGHRVMLSVAYGRDQRDGLVVHHPEVCYPAQGFDVLSNRWDVLRTHRGDIPLRRLETMAGTVRREPVTYWTTVGDRVTKGSISKKIHEMHYSLRGQIPDGLLFRVSSIGVDTAAEFVVHDKFVTDLLEHVSPPVRLYLAGLP